MFDEILMSLMCQVAATTQRNVRGQHGRWLRPPWWLPVANMMMTMMMHNNIFPIFRYEDYADGRISPADDNCNSLHKNEHSVLAWKPFVTSNASIHFHQLYVRHQAQTNPANLIYEAQELWFIVELIDVRGALKDLKDWLVNKKGQKLSGKIAWAIKFHNLHMTHTQIFT